MSGCCNEHGCERKNPILLIRSDLTDTWYVVTDYTDKGNGHFVAKTKHRLSDDQQRQLEQMRSDV